MGVFRCTAFVRDLELDFHNCVESVDVYLNVDAYIEKYIDGAGKTWYNVDISGFEVLECCLTSHNDMRLHSAHDGFSGLKDQAEKYINDNRERLIGSVLSDYLEENA